MSDIEIKYKGKGKREKGKEEIKCHCEGANNLTSTKERLCHCEEGKPDEAIQKENLSTVRPFDLLTLTSLLDSKSCFKLICGAGNENLDEVEKLVALYSAAGCHFFDLSANEEVLAAAQRGLDFSIPKNGQNGAQKDYHFCISIGTKNDVHVQKAQIDAEKCIACGKCVEVCLQKAVKEIGNRKWEIDKRNCIGCLKCKAVCNFDAIAIIFPTLHYTFSPSIPYSLFPISCIELHASDTNEAEVDEIWSELQNFEGMLSLCIGREKLSNEKVLSRIKRLIKDREPYTTIIQADGSPMSGGEDDFKTTLQSVAMAEVIQGVNGANLPVYILLSGGTNSKTAELAKLCGVNFHGIAAGSYARKIVKKYIEREDFFENKIIFEEASKIAKIFIQSTKL